MGYCKWAFIIIIIQTTIVHSTAYMSNNGKLYKLVTQLSIEKDNKLNADEYMLSTVDKCKYKCTISYLPHSRYNGDRRSFIDLGNNTSTNGSEVEPPAPKLSFFNLLTGEDSEDNDKTNDIDEYGSGDSLKEDYEINDEDNDNDNDDDDDDDDSIDFFGYDDEENEDETEIKDEDGLLKQYHRHRLRMHNLVFPLLLAYKLKFFTVIPLLLGSLVLLVGTTGIAGFFFALFAAALGIHVKSHHEH